MSNNFLQFDSSGANMLSDEDYAANSQRIGGVVPGIASSALHNKLFYQTSTMSAAMGESLSNLGYTVSDSNLSALTAIITEVLSGFPGDKFGCQISNNSTDPNNDIDIAVGSWMNQTGTARMVLSSPLTKQLDAAWTAGNNQGGLFSGSKTANTCYHVFLISTAAGVSDVGFDTSITAANRPPSYVNYRRIGSILTDNSSNIRGFIQYENYFGYTDPITDVNATQGTANTTRTLTLPTGKRVLADIFARWQSAENDNFLCISEPTMTNTNPSIQFGMNDEDATTAIGGRLSVLTNTSGQIRTRMENSSASITVITYGYWDSF